MCTIQESTQDLHQFLKSTAVDLEDQNNRKTLDSLRLKVMDDHQVLSEPIADYLGLHINTVKRWWELKSIPVHYYDDLIRFCERGSTNKGKNGNKDRFYTKPRTAQYCLDVLEKVALSLDVDLSKYDYLEPSAGEGAFFNLFPVDRRIGIDLQPTSNSPIEIRQDDFLQWHPTKGQKLVVLGNPPFGLRGHLALQFINRSAKFADLIGFILPQLFASDGKGVPAKRVDRRLRLAHSEILEDNHFLLPDGTDTVVSTIFQVWSKVSHPKIPLVRQKTCKDYIKVYSLSDGGTPASTRNKKMINQCDVYLPSTCFKGMKAYSEFELLPHRRGYGIVIYKNKSTIKEVLESHDWEQTAFNSTNGALNLRMSLIESVVIRKGFFDAI